MNIERHRTYDSVGACIYDELDERDKTLANTVIARFVEQCARFSAAKVPHIQLTPGEI